MLERDNTVRFPSWVGGDDLLQKAWLIGAGLMAPHKRKYTGAPYFDHCEEVAQLLHSVGEDRDVVAAGLLHDCLEMSPITVAELESHFGAAVAGLVDEVTDRTTQQDGTRAQRKALERDRLSWVSNQAKSIKLADMLSNGATLIVRDPKFAKVYLPELKALFPRVSDGGNARLAARVRAMLVTAFQQLGLSDG